LFRKTYTNTHYPANVKLWSLPARGGSLPLFVIFLVAQGSAWKSADVVAVVGLFTSVLGTLVDAFIGLGLARQGKKKNRRIAKMQKDWLGVQ
jgi:hypothetical protein